MPRINRPRRAGKQCRKFTSAADKLTDLAWWLLDHVLAIRASVHSVEMFFPHSLTYAVQQHILTQLRNLHDPYADDPRRSIRLKQSIYHGVLQGYRLIVNEPCPALLPVLDRLAAKHRATVARVDVAVDWITRTTDDAKWLEAFLLKYALLRWRRRQAMRDVATWWPSTHYWCQKRPRRSRDLVLYVKNDGDRDYAHLELRFFSTQSCRRQGWHRPLDLLALDPGGLFQRHVRLSFDIDRYVQQSVRRQVKDAMMAARAVPRSRPLLPILAKWDSGAWLARHIRAAWERSGCYRAQWLRDHAPRSFSSTASLLQVMAIPTELGAMIVAPVRTAPLTPPLPKTSMKSSNPSIKSTVP